MKASKTINLRLTSDELETIDELAKTRGITRSAYIKDCALNGGAHMLDTKTILTKVAFISNMVNDIQPVDVAGSNLKDELKKGVVDLWQCLS